MNKRLYYLELVFNCLLGLLAAILLPFGIKYIVNSGGYSFFIKMLILFAPIISVVSMLLIPFYGIKRFMYDYLSIFLVLIEVAILVFLGMLYVATRLWYRIFIFVNILPHRLNISINDFVYKDLSKKCTRNWYKIRKINL